jgi:hypothetical protein
VTKLENMVGAALSPLIVKEKPLQLDYKDYKIDALLPTSEKLLSDEKKDNVLFLINLRI